MDHDQRFKTLLKRFLGDFFQLFFPDWAARFDFDNVEWLDTEVFPDPPDGSRRVLDLVALLETVQEDSQRHSLEAPKKWLSLVHIEIESSDSMPSFRKRMHWYCANLRQRHDEPILPVAVLLHVGSDGIGHDEYVETHGSLEVLRFQYLCVGLPKLEAIEYVTRPEPLAAALAALMRPPAGKKPELKATALQRISSAALNDFDRYLLMECVDKYLGLDADEEVAYQSLLQDPSFQKARAMAITTFEKGEEQGLRRALRLVLTNRFGNLPRELDVKIDTIPGDLLSGLIEQASSASDVAEMTWPESVSGE